MYYETFYNENKSFGKEMLTQILMFLETFSQLFYLLGTLLILLCMFSLCELLGLCLILLESAFL